MNGEKTFRIRALHTYARHTGMGAKTWFIVLSKEKGDVTIRMYNFSRTGNHWEEVLEVTPDFAGKVELMDVTNSGKHRCKLYIFQDGKVTGFRAPTEEYWREPCPICKEAPIEATLDEEARDFIEYE